MRDELYSDRELTVELVENDDGTLGIEMQSRPGGPALDVTDEVVVVVAVGDQGGRACAVHADGPRTARAVLGRIEELAEQPFELMIRIHEFFEGWDFNGPDDA